MNRLCKVAQYTLSTVCFLLFLGMMTPQASAAQINLERISVTERSDGRGYVIRHHFNERPDSFRVSQPDLYTLQLYLYHDEIVYQNYEAPDNRILEEIQIIQLDYGIGVEYRIRENHYFSTASYFDRNQSDVLISLESTSQAVAAVQSAAASRLFMIDEPATLDTKATGPPIHETQITDTETEEEAAQSPDRYKFDTFLSKRNPAALHRLPIGDPFELYLRSVYPKTGSETSSSFLMRPVQSTGINKTTIQPAHPWMNQSLFQEQVNDEGAFDYVIYNPVAYMSNNSEIPLGQNDGILWQGRGTNYFLSGGAGVQYGPFTAVFRPQFAYSENLEYTEIETFDISIHPRYGGSEYQMYLTYADIPLRFGDQSFSRFDLGDSFLQLEYAGFGGGISNERMWTGPAIHNPLIFSNHAPGFIHGYLGTTAPFFTRYGNLEARWIWGRLKESDYFDDNPDNDDRFVTAFTLNYSPSFIPGLHLGVTRAAYSYTGNGSLLADMFMAFKPSQSKEVTNPDEAVFNMTSYYARWLFEAANVEVYTEWGRNDHKRSFRDILAEPELNRGYVLGFLKNFHITNSRRLLLNTEITKLENSSVTATQRDYNIWYTNPVIGQGFTHKGRVLGAGIGPGSSTQQVHLHYYDKWGMLGISGARIAHHMDRHFRYEDYFRSFVNFPQFYFILSRHEIEMRYGFNVLLFLPNNLELEAGYIIGKVENRYNLRLQDIDNHQYSFTLRYNISRTVR